MRTILTILLFVWFLATSEAANFPAPQFQTGYNLPTSQTPHPRSFAREYIDVAVLFCALAAAAYLALRKRSRKLMLFLALFSLAYFGFWRKGCVCAIGSIQNVALWFADPTYALSLSVLAFFALPLLFALFFGRVFCAAVCPLGAIQDVVILKPLKIPRDLAAALCVFPYLYLSLAALLAVTGAGFVICRFDPFVSFFRVSGSAPLLFFGAALLLIGVRIARPYCRFICPYAVLLNWCSRVSKWHLTITPTECVKCRLCEEACPFDAIPKPNTEQSQEPRSTAVKRMTTLLLLVPILTLAGALAGRWMERPLARLNPTVQLAEEVLRQEKSPEASDKSLEIEAFNATGAKTSDLYADALQLTRRFKLGGMLIGGFLGLTLGCKLIGLSVRRTREDYEPDRGECLSCARCFLYCPKERERIKTATQPCGSD